MNETLLNWVNNMIQYYENRIDHFKNIIKLVSQIQFGYRQIKKRISPLNDFENDF